jgi:hypothetical protein
MSADEVKITSVEEEPVEDANVPDAEYAKWMYHHMVENPAETGEDPRIQDILKKALYSFILMATAQEMHQHPADKGSST